MSSAPYGLPDVLQARVAELEERVATLTEALTGLAAAAESVLPVEGIPVEGPSWDRLDAELVRARAALARSAGVGGEPERPYADLSDDELERLHDERFQFRDWDSVEMLQAEMRARGVGGEGQ